MLRYFERPKRGFLGENGTSRALHGVISCAILLMFLRKCLVFKAISLSKTAQHQNWRFGLLYG